MAKRTPIKSHLPTRYLAQKSLTSPTPEQGRVWAALSMASAGHSISTIVRETGAHRNSIRAWIARYNEEGAGFQPPVAKRPAPWRKQLG